MDMWVISLIVGRDKRILLVQLCDDDSFDRLVSQPEHVAYSCSILICLTRGRVRARCKCELFETKYNDPSGPFWSVSLHNIY